MVAVSSVLAIGWRMGILPDGPLPFIGLSISNGQYLPYVIGSLLGYALFRMWIEWVQSDQKRRQRVASKIDIGTATAIGVVAATGIGTRLVTLPFPTLRVVVQVIGTVGLGLALGGVLSLAVTDSLVIRPKEEALRLALPRFPVALRANLRFAAIVSAVVGIVGVAVHLFRLSVAPFYIQLVFGTAALTLLSDPRGLLFAVFRLSRVGGTSRADYIRDLRWAVDMHDTNYQIGGWDTWVEGQNTRLYQSAERGDATDVAAYLAQGDDPNQANMHGWTALMIAVAQQHADTAEVILNAGADPNRHNSLGRSSLMFAARYGNARLVRMLLDYGADPNLNKSAEGGALAAAAEGGHLRPMELLLDAGADPAACDMRRRSVLAYAEAAKQGKAAALLRRRIRDAKSKGR